MRYTYTNTTNKRISETNIPLMLILLLRSRHSGIPDISYPLAARGMQKKTSCELNSFLFRQLLPDADS